MMLLLAHWCLAVAGVRHKSNTFDEVAHLTAGVGYWRQGDFRLNPEGGMTAQRWAALPLLAEQFVGPDPSFPGWAAGDIWSVGFHFLYEANSDADTMLFRARTMAALLSVLLAALVWAWSLHLFGPNGALLSLALCALSPTMLAHGRLVTADTAAALAFMAALSGIWIMLHRLTPLTVLAAGLSVGLLLLTKMSGVLMIPIALLLLLVRLLAGGPLGLGWLLRARLLIGGAVRCRAMLIGAALLCAALAWTTVWAGYGFRFSAGPDGMGIAAERWETVGGDGLLPAAVSTARRHRLLPEAWLYGFAHAHRHAQRRVAFLDGQTSAVGWLRFFPCAFAYKTPVASLAAFAIAIGLLLRHWRRSARDGAPARRVLGIGLYRVAPLALFIGAYTSLALSSRLNIGHRHILPIYPVLFALAGVVAVGAPPLSRARVATIFLLVIGLGVESLMAWPHHLAFFNVAAGGPAGGHRHLVDSSLDWGQDLPGLRRWLDEQGPHDPGAPPVYLAYFGTAHPDHYGIRARLLPCFFPRPRTGPPEPLVAGTYCISATMLQCVYLPCRGRWCELYEQQYQRLAADVVRFRQAAGQSEARPPRPGQPADERRSRLFDDFEALRLGRLCAFLRRRPPDADVGHSILIYRLEPDEVLAALHDGPAELYPDAGVRLER